MSRESLRSPDGPSKVMPRRSCSRAGVLLKSVDTAGLPGDAVSVAMVNTETVNQRYHRLMSEQPPSGPPAPSGTGGFPAIARPVSRRAGRTASVAVDATAWAVSRCSHSLALAIALDRYGPRDRGVVPTLGTRSVRSAPSRAPTYTEQQSRRCEISRVHRVRHGAQRGNATNGTGNSEQLTRPWLKPKRRLAELSVMAGGWYLRDQLDPAAPPRCRSDPRIELSGTCLLDLWVQTI